MTMKIPMTWIFLLSMTLFYFSPLAAMAQTGDELPQVKMKFVNDSRFAIHIHFYSHETLVQAKLLKPKENFEQKVDHGIVIHLEYAPPPHKTVLRPIDSLQQISRAVTFSNDGEHVRIKEKFQYTKNAKIDDKKKKKKRKPEEKSP